MDVFGYAGKDGYSLSVSDAFALNKGGMVIFYYVEKTGLTRITGFIMDIYASAPVSLDTTDFSIDRKEGSWPAFESMVIDGKPFF